MRTLLSIIVPMYNVEQYIGSCLDSLLNQGFEDNSYEIIIINDGSTDNSLKIVEDFANRYTNIRIMTQKNAGQSAARNTGLKMAVGDFICFVDADDFLVKDKLASLVQIAQNNKVEILTYNILGGTYADILRKIGENSTCEHISEVQDGIEYIAKYNYNNGPWYYLIKRSFIEKIGLCFIEGRKCEDGIFTMNLLLESHRILHVNIPVYCYIIRDNSTVTNTNSEHLKKMIQDFIFAVFSLTEIIEKYRTSMNKECLQRCICRRDSYILFLLVRLMKAKVSYKEIKKIIASLQDKNLYPFGSLALDYHERVFSYLTKLFNVPMVYYTLCYLYRIFK